MFDTNTTSMDSQHRWRYFLIFLLLTALGLLPGCPADTSESSGTAETDGTSETALQAQLGFTEITQPAGLGEFFHETGAFGNKWMPETFGSGGGFIDYNGDAWEDILLMGGGAWPEYSNKTAQALWLYKNNGDGTFTQVTEEAGLQDVATYSFGFTVADYDNDGDQDFFLTTLYENLLFRNDDGVFTEVGSEAGVSNQSTWSTASMFIDADRDGYLDLYAGNYVDWGPDNDIFCSMDGKTKAYCTPALYNGVPGRFYHNNGDGTFTDVTESAGFLPAPGKTLGVSETDFNRDGWPDIVVANDTERNLLYENNRDGTFTEKGLVSGIAFDEVGKARAGMGVESGVVDSTGEVTIFIGNFSNEMIGVFRHTDSGYFTDRAALSKIGRPSLLILTFSVILFDVDYDTDLDLYCANGHIQKLIQDGSTYRQPSQLYVNRGNGIFEERSREIGGPLLKPLVSRGAACADIDRDGDLDILITENGGPVYLWRNDSDIGQFLRVRLQGTSSNPDGVNSSVKAYLGDYMMERRVRTGSSYLATSEKPVTFGLGQATAVDSLVIQWPSGNRDTYTNVQANQMIRIVEGSGTYVQESLPGYAGSRDLARRYENKSRTQEGKRARIQYFNTQYPIFNTQNFNIQNSHLPALDIGGRFGSKEISPGASKYSQTPNI